MKKQNLSREFKLNSLYTVIAFIITVYFVITGPFIQEGFSISIGDVSDRLFTAPRQVENRVATDRLRREAEESVQDRYSKEPEIEEKILNNLDTFFTELHSLRVLNTPIFVPGMEMEAEAVEAFEPENQEILESTMISDGSEETVEEAEVVYPEIFEEFNPLLVEYLVELDTQTYNAFELDVRDYMDQVLDEGVRTNNMDRVLIGIKSYFDDAYVEAELSQLGYEIIAVFLEPNFTYDEETTQDLREEAVSKVEPVYLLKNQKIVGEAEIITEEVYFILDDLGYIANNGIENLLPILGAVFLIISVFGFAIFYIILFHEDFGQNNKEVLLLFTLYMIVIFAAKMLSSALYMFIPVLAFTMLIGILLDYRMSLVLNIVVAVVTMLITKGEFEYLVYYLVTGTIMSLVSRYSNQRNNVFFVSLIISSVCAVVCGSLGILVERNFANNIIMNLLYAFLNGFFTVIVCVGSLPFWEAVFGIVTPIRLLDLVNPNNELLRRMTIEAPGTYHHSLIVANLAETAAYDIGADPNIARVGGYYHDIGKLKYPQYFSENQVGTNPHDDMDPYSSVQVITSHLDFGIQLAEEHNLPKPVKDVISQHHGNTLVKYFYIKAKNDSEEEIDENDFRYKQPIPQSKEAAVVMLADTVEAAVRSMFSKSKTMDEVNAFVRSLIKDKLDDGQLKDSGFTIKDVDTVGDSFMRVFKGMYHERIPYPKDEKKVKKALPTEENDKNEDK